MTSIRWHLRPARSGAIVRLLGALALVTLLLSSAFGAEQDGFIYTTSETTATITGYNGPGGEVVIPQTLGGKSVTAIGDRAFWQRTEITRITIPNGLHSIGRSAFFGCTGLTNVSIPRSLTSMGSQLFSGCTGLAAIDVEEGNQTYSSLDGTLMDRAQSEILIYPSGKVGSYLIPQSVTSIGWFAFSGCVGLTGVTIPDTVTSIGDYAFNGCTGLTNVTIPNSVTLLGSSVFGECSGLESVTLSDRLTSIEYNTFIKCSVLSAVTIPNGVTSIQTGAFSGCKGLTSIRIPEKVTSIGLLSFSGCSGLTNVTIPESVTSIGDYAFYACIGLTSVILPEGVTTIGRGQFSTCWNLTNVTLGTKVSSIGAEAFAACRELATITIPSGVSSIEERVFAYCPKLTSVYFEGDRPLFGAAGFAAFLESPFVTVFYASDSEGWQSTFGDRPTAFWVERPRYESWVVETGLMDRFPGASGPGDDADGDGVANGEEWIASTDPTQGASRLELEMAGRMADLAEADKIAVEGANHALYFRSSPGRYYGVQATEEFGGPWELKAVRVASASQTRFVVPRPAGREFYRVVALP